MIPYFSYELTAIPTSLFKDGAMRKTQKSQLAKIVTSDVQPAECNVRTSYVIDGGALLHKVKWAKKAAYKDILLQYVRYVHAKYGQRTCIVFDGYESGPSTKDQEHLRRLGKVCADIQLSEYSLVYFTGFLKERLLFYDFFVQLKWSRRVYTLKAESGLM